MILKLQRKTKNNLVAERHPYARIEKMTDEEYHGHSGEKPQKGIITPPGEIGKAILTRNR